MNIFQNFSFSEKKTGVVPVPKHINFNKEQLKAIDSIKSFLKSNESYYCLIGKGGTGKTTVIAGALTGFSSIIGVAISHKATQRLSSSIQDCYTFASACALKVDTNDLGEKVFVENPYARKIPMQTAKYIVVDECSMISKEGIKIIEKLRRSDSKVIFMGDFRQLPPIDETGKDSYTFKVKNRSSLTERIRQGANNPIVELSDVIANEIETKSYNPYVIHDYLKTDINPENNKGYSYTDDSEFVKKFVEDFKKDNSTKFISFRTNTVKRYNKRIRETIYKGVKNVFVKGELIIANNTYYKGDELILKNSAEYYIENVNVSEYKGYECFIIFVKGQDSQIPVLTKIGRMKWNKELKYLSSKNMWKKFWPLKEAFAEIDYGYAVNTHKSQGSTYRNVYMDFNDILNVSKTSNKEKCQSLYVAITRASHNLYLLDI